MLGNPAARWNIHLADPARGRSGGVAGWLGCKPPNGGLRWQGSCRRVRRGATLEVTMALLSPSGGSLPAGARRCQPKSCLRRQLDAPCPPGSDTGKPARSARSRLPADPVSIATPQSHRLPAVRVLPRCLGGSLRGGLVMPAVSVVATFKPLPVARPDRWRWMLRIATQTGRLERYGLVQPHRRRGCRYGRSTHRR